MSNKTSDLRFENKQYARNTSITLEGFKPDKTYQFYCVLNSDGRIYSKSISIDCIKSLLLIKTNKQTFRNQLIFSIIHQHDG